LQGQPEEGQRKHQKNKALRWFQRRNVISAQCSERQREEIQASGGNYDSLLNFVRRTTSTKTSPVIQFGFGRPVWASL
jgi:hypothetical protein